MRYFLNDYDRAYAIDEAGNEFFLTKKKGLVPVEKGTVDYIMWENVTKERAMACAL